MGFRVFCRFGGPPLCVAPLPPAPHQQGPPLQPPHPAEEFHWIRGITPEMSTQVAGIRQGRRDTLYMHAALLKQSWGLP